jgi:two-component system NtrC family sensor kinase
MGRLGVTKKKKSPRASELTQLKKELRRVSEQLERRGQELAAALEQQIATSEILGVIASSPTDIQSVLDTVADSAARLCGANDATIFRVEGEFLRRVASYGSLPSAREHFALSRRIPPGRAIINRKTIHIHDLQPVREKEFPDARGRGIRTVLAIPLLREDVPIGAVVIRRLEVHPFSDKQIALLKTFADQAVIAIENVRLFKELEARNRDLTEALEQQTATSEILRVIASSPTELQPVLNVIAENAAHVCGAEDAVIRLAEGDILQLAAHYGPLQLVAPKRPIDRLSPPGRAMLDRQIVHIEDMQPLVETEFPRVYDSIKGTGVRTVLAVPLMRESVPIGTITIRREKLQKLWNIRPRRAKS